MHTRPPHDCVQLSPCPPTAGPRMQPSLSTATATTLQHRPPYSPPQPQPSSCVLLCTCVKGAQQVHRQPQPKKRSLAPTPLARSVSWCAHAGRGKPSAQATTAEEKKSHTHTPGSQARARPACRNSGKRHTCTPKGTHAGCINTTPNADTHAAHACLANTAPGIVMLLL
jgi:hypothetical protein